MFGEKQQKQDADTFWREFEEKNGEKTLAFTLGQYLSGWEAFDSRKEAPLWGLVIATSGGLRFHHFAQHNWLGAMLRAGQLSPEPKEKTFFIPRESITSAEIRREKNWCKRIFMGAQPELLVRYRDDCGKQRTLAVQIEHKTEGLVENLMRGADIS